MLAIACLLVAATFAHFITPWVLLLLTFALSIGDALESPAWRAIFPELVPKQDLSPALALNGIEFNLARAVGPALGGVIIATGLLREFTRVRGELLAGSGNEQVILGATLALISLSS
jgi:MFS family permease